MGQTTLQPHHRPDYARTAANSLSLGMTSAALMATKGTRAAHLAPRAGGAMAAISGIGQLVFRDQLQSVSVVGSAAQTIGGFGMLIAANPIGQRRATTIALGGTLLNALDAYVPNERLKTVLKGAVAGSTIVGALGVGVDPEKTVVATLVGGAVGGLAAAAAINLPRP